MISKLLGVVLLICLFPLFIVVALVIILDDGFPIIFRQKRIGKNNIQFLIYKFRTMKKGTPDIATHLVDDSQSLYTLIGPLLRKFSFDELPQLINIIKGDMKFIGPRPSLYNQEDLNELRTRAGLDILFPGVTGWAQVNGRDDLSIEEKVKMDTYYMNNQSFLLNIKILYLTILRVFKAENVDI
mgnify:CR=1 FL=1|tara:strand:- start:1783 stop:2334 length:552 start_codon:yes stop_codon:yes gene_type:complete